MVVLWSNLPTGTASRSTSSGSSSAEAPTWLSQRTTSCRNSSASGSFASFSMMARHDTAASTSARAATRATYGGFGKSSASFRSI